MVTQLSGAASAQPVSASGTATDEASALTCGVALCTYNGVLYLGEQLASILSQTRLPDRIVIFDDMSTDGTWDYVQRWALASPIPTAVSRHSSQQGIARNFAAAIAALDTDIVFACDQDDIWSDDKIAAIMPFFADPAVQLVHTNALLVDADNRDLGLTLFDALAVTEEERRRVRENDAFSALCRRNLVTGATSAFRRSLFDAARPFPPGWIHDEWLAIIAAVVGRIVLLDKLSIRYRQHANNAIGAKRPSAWHLVSRARKLLKLPRGRFQALRLERALALRDKLETMPTVRDSYKLLAQQKLDYAQALSSLPRNPFQRLHKVFSQAANGKYKQFSGGNRGVVRDILNR